MLKMIGGAGKDDACPICIDSGDLVDDNGRVYKMIQYCPEGPDGHWAHLPCITEWLKRETFCPICRTNLMDTDIYKNANPGSRRANPNVYNPNIDFALEDLRSSIHESGFFRTIRPRRQQGQRGQRAVGLWESARGIRTNEGPYRSDRLTDKQREVLRIRAEIEELKKKRTNDLANTYTRFDGNNPIPLMAGTEDCNDYARCWESIYKPRFIQLLRSYEVPEHLIPYVQTSRNWETQEQLSRFLERRFGENSEDRSIRTGGAEDPTNDPKFATMDLNAIKELELLGYIWPEFYHRIGRGEKYKDYIRRTGLDEQIFVRKLFFM